MAERRMTVVIALRAAARQPDTATFFLASGSTVMWLWLSKLKMLAEMLRVDNLTLAREGPT